MNGIIVNKVMRRIKATSEGADELLRIIWISQDGRFAQYVSLAIDVAMPHPIKISDIQSAFESGFMSDGDDPFARVIDENEIPDSYRAIRERKWQIASYVWEKNTERALLKKERPKLFEEAANIFNVHPMDVRRTMSRFWQRGMVPNALLPDFDKRGLRGVQKADTMKKRGRPRERFEYDAEMSGINITEDVKDKIRESIDMFYLSKSKPTIKDTYNRMLSRYFSDISYKNGEIQPIIWETDRIPSYHQFYYWFKQFTNTKNNIIKREGERVFALKYRELLGDTTAEAFGPGFKYQIDATIADVYLVSKVSPKYIIGRPILYLIIDVFSRMVVGMYVGIEGPSWVGAMMAFDNVVADKVEFCKQYDIKIRPEDWPSSLLPERLLADRGEFEGICPESIIKNLGITIENTPPYRGDLKGIVERHFRTTNERIKRRLPGAVRKAVKERGETDYRLDAQLNIEDFTKVMIHEVIRHNTSVMEQYSKSMLEISDNVRSVPVEIWQWGIANRRCGFVARDRDFVRLSLMPREKAAITREGIKFHGIYYSCDMAIREGWFINPQRTSVQVAYDPRRLDNIYIPDDTGRGYTKCFPVANSKKFGSISYDDYVMLQKYLEEEKVSLKASKTQREIDIDSEIQKIVRQAKKRAETGEQGNMSKTERLRNIRSNRAVERDLRHDEESFELGAEQAGKKDDDRQQTKKNEIVAFSEEKKKKTQSDYEDEILDLLKRKGDEKLGGKK